jgi:hypothetical protein
VRGRGGRGGPPAGDPIIDGLIRANTVAARALVEIIDESRTPEQRWLAALGRSVGRLQSCADSRPGEKVAAARDVAAPLGHTLQQLDLHARLAIRAAPLDNQKVTALRQLVASAGRNIARAIMARRRQLGR